MRLSLVPSDNKILKAVAKPVKRPASAAALVRDLIDTMIAEGGVGLAAPQVGRAERVFVTGVGGDYRAYINPQIVRSSAEQIWWEEGCLSLPRLLGQVKRPKEVTLRFVRADGQPGEIIADELLGRVLQHELDHLDGILFPDRMDDLSSLRRLTEEEWQSRFDGAKQQTFDAE